MNATYKRSAFTLIELLVVIAIIAILIAILVPGLLAAKMYAWKTLDGTHVKGETQMFMVWALGHADAKSNVKPFPRISLPNGRAGGQLAPDSNVLTRHQVLLDDPQTKMPAATLICPASKTDVVGTPDASGYYTLAKTNASYALLWQYDATWNTPPNTTGQIDWQYNGFNMSPVVATKKVSSGSAFNKKVWQGNVGWGDMHADWHLNSFMDTALGSGPNAGTQYPQNDIFNGQYTNPVTQAVDWKNPSPGFGVEAQYMTNP